jgi:hypothetical protein
VISGIDVWLNKKRTQTDSSGYFRFEGVPPGKYKIRVGNTFWRGPDFEIEVSSNQSVDLGSIKLVLRIGRGLGVFSFTLGVSKGIVDKDPIAPLWGLVGWGIGEFVDSIIANSVNG